jgi:Flp pilus assembly protein TadD
MSFFAKKFERAVQVMRAGRRPLAAMLIAGAWAGVSIGSSFCPANCEPQADAEELRPAPAEASSSDEAGKPQTEMEGSDESERSADSGEHRSSPTFDSPADSDRPFRARAMDTTRTDDMMPQVGDPIPDRETVKESDSAPSDEESEVEKAETQATGDEKRADIDPVPHYKKAVQLTKDKNYKEALEALEKALLHNPSYLEARYQMAFVYQMMGNSKTAIRKYKQYLKIKPEDIQARINLGTLLKTSGDQAGAEAEFKKAIEGHFYSFIAHYDLANLLVEQGRLEEAQKEYKLCLKLKPNNALVHNNLGVIYQRRNYLEEADEEFNKALRLDPGNKVFHTNVALVRTQLKKGM